MFKLMSYQIPDLCVAEATTLDKLVRVYFKYVDEWLTASEFMAEYGGYIAMAEDVIPEAVVRESILEEAKVLS